MTAPYDLRYQGISHIFHTVGPTSKSEAALIGCYRTVLECCLTYGVRTIAIPAVATGIFGFPKHQACNIALGTVRAWLEADPARAARVDTVVFCQFGDDGMMLYKGHLPVYFPTEADDTPFPNADRYGMVHGIIDPTHDPFAAGPPPPPADGMHDGIVDTDALPPSYSVKSKRCLFCLNGLSWHG